MNALELIQKLHIPYREHGAHHHTTSRFIQIDCPWCSPGQSRWRMGIRLDGRRATCWVCGPHYVANTLSEASQIPRKTVSKLLEDLEEDEVELKVRAGKLTLPPGVGPLLKPHRQYLEKRGIDPDEASKLWGARGLGQVGRLPWHVFIPIRQGASVVSWTTRSLDDTGRRYTNARPDEEVVGCNTVLYGEEYVKHTVLVVEGPLDVWKVGPGAVATLGSNPSTHQLLAIAQYPRRVVCYDNEEEAQHKARWMVGQLSIMPGQTSLITLDAKDPGCASEKELSQLRRYLQ